MVARTKRRVLNHSVLTVSVACAFCGVFAASQLPNDHTRWSLATGYVGLALIVATLLIGPVNALRGVRTPLSTDLRRDIGIWACVLSAWHVVLGLQSHFVGKMWKYFFYQTKEGIGGVRHDMFGWANHTGLLATLLILLLALLSNDLSVRTLGGPRWKNFQRSNYALLVLVAVHTVLYQVLEKRLPVYAVVLGAVVVVLLLLRAVRMVRNRR